MKISYITTYNALDIRNWSGTGFMIAEALKNQDNELDYIGNLTAKPGINLYLNKIYNKLIGKNVDLSREPYVAEQYARQIEILLKPNSDLIFSPGTTPISLLKTNKPKVFYTDATFAGMIGFYEYLNNLSNNNIANGNYLEQQALDNSNLAIYSSDWAAKTAIDNYNVEPSKVKVVPFGSNIQSDRDLKIIKGIIATRSTTQCNLLFLAVDWSRKGGDMAVKIAARLNEMGLKTTLHIAGIKNIPLSNIPSFIINHGYISKSNKEGRNKIDRLLAQSNFLILPTQADCTPIVFSEANSFGLPCISTNVGGISTILRDGLNGKAFPLVSDENVYADYIQSIFSNKELYKQLALSSFHEYESRLNWDVTGKTIMKLLHEL
ncbi:glycosyltransferase family 4 protein [Dyadobacter sp. LHD-138]|uniref:glycosyltransferase family 4 protein n=1 Tax=Dyadobacter sp. LHD-138 TaxID=3071413 RepID=UPI0027DF6B8B|nr:glycosyltransferase family 4 protein [Dyadobacter sp. LHD-138]MDQ6482602.1 glycosyltransferase family 4 protein [Dyadobacter sp. LHD-138]